MEYKFMEVRLYYANWQRGGGIIDRVLYDVTIDEGTIDRG